MTSTRKFTETVLALAMILAMLLSLTQTQPAAAQAGDGVRREINSESGKVNFIGPAAGKRTVSARALGIVHGAQAPTPAKAAMALAKRFAPEFGIDNPERDLIQMKTRTQEDGRVTVRYQQKYQGIPVIGGELIVNSNEIGDLYSMNGEVGQKLSLDTQPTLAMETAIDIAKQGMAKWYGGEPTDYQYTEAALWIFDEQLLRPSSRPAELVWRLEIATAQQAKPIRELVLVNAKTGNVSLHFNQIDTAWGENTKPGSADKTTNSPARHVAAQTGTIWYVTTTGNDSNSCSAPASPCATITGALSKEPDFLDGDTIQVATGTYNNTTSYVTITKSATLSGGWNNTFTTQSYTASEIADQFSIGPGVSVTIERINISRSGPDITNQVGISLNGGTLKFVDGKISSLTSGLLSSDGQATLVNAVITANGRGIHVTGTSTSASVTLVNSTVAYNNSSTDAGGIMNAGSGKVYLVNSLVVGNTGGDADCSGKVVSRGYNLIGTIGSGYPYSCGATWLYSDYVGYGSEPYTVSDVIDTNFNPVLGSPAIDYGNPVIPGSSELACPPKDGIGVDRPQSWACDIGAREYVFSHSSSMLLSTYNANNLVELPGSLVCTQADLSCSSTTDNDARKAHHFAAEVYDLYFTKHNRNSIDGNGMEIISSVHYGADEDNAFWDNYMIVYGDVSGYVNADDIVAHELTHGVTQFESNLFYYYQSGAINESFSDLWGEYFDQNNLEGNDTSGAKWLIGEDVTGYGAFRSMKTPTDYGQADKITSSLYYKGIKNNGGVHRNSGINNKAVSLMVDGGTFNGKTVTGIGWDKTAAIYYKVQTDLLSSGANYSDLYSAVQQACTDLIPSVVTAANCQEVKDALDAVEMNLPIPAAFNPEASACPTGKVTVPSLTLFSDDLELGTDNWNTDLGWSYADFNSSSPSHAMYGDDQMPKLNAALTLKNSVAIPANSTSFLYFRHSFDFEYYSSEYYDGGVLEYSKDNGVTWKDANLLFSAGQKYNGTILSVYPGVDYPSKNPLKGRQGFIAKSHGYVSSRYSLTSLAGKSVKFRWRYGTDEHASSTGWSVDDISIYECVGTPAIPVLTSPLNNENVTDYTPYLDWADAKPSLHHYQLQIATDTNFTGLIHEETSLTTSDFTVPDSLLQPNTPYYWRVQGFNILDTTLGWSPTWMFHTALLPPVLAAPAEGEPLLTRRPTLDWGDVTDATGYKLLVSKYPDFSTPLLSVAISDSIYHDYDWTADLPAGKLIYWRVKAMGANPSAWTAATFTTGKPPSTPVLQLPANDALVQGYTPLLDWSDSTAPTGTVFDHYWLQIATDTDFMGLIHEETSLTTSDFTVPDSLLQPNTPYYWRVRAFNAAGHFSSWSLTWSFRTALTPPVLVAPTEGELLLTRRPTLDWEDVTDATGYKLLVSKYPDFRTSILSVNLTDSTYLDTDWLADLPPNRVIYWRVKATGANPSAWMTASFTTGP